MRRSPVHVDRPVNSLPAALVGHLCNGELAVTQKILAIMGKGSEDALDRYTHAQEERIRAAGELLTGKFKSSDS